MEGVFTGKIKTYGITETKDGSPQVAVSFEVSESETAKKNLTWFGTLKDGRGQEITLDALLTMGYTQKSFDALADGKGLDEAAEYSLTIAEEPDQNGKTQTRIKWVNALGGGAMKNKLAKEDAIKKIKGMNLDAALMMRMNEKGIKQKPLETPGFKESDIDF